MVSKIKIVIVSCVIYGTSIKLKRPQFFEAATVASETIDMGIKNLRTKLFKRVRAKLFVHLKLSIFN